MSLKVLTPGQVEQFIECGYTRLDEAFPRKEALRAQDFLWQRVEERGALREDRSTWTQPMVHIRENYSDPAFGGCNTVRLADAVEDLVGRGRWRGRESKVYWGWWPVNFAVGADQPWDVPTGGWHWDGQHFRHAVDAPDQGVLLLCVFSEVGPRGGGTLVAEGSHRVVARYLAQYPDGLEHQQALQECRQSHPWLRQLMGIDPIPDDGLGTNGSTPRIRRFIAQQTLDEHGAPLRVAETTASPGDILLCHPFLYHSASQNHSGVPRFMCNRTTPLYERMRLEREDGDYSAVEISIRKALGR